MSKSMSFSERMAADWAEAEKRLRRENRQFVLLMIGTAIGGMALFLALVVAFPFIRYWIRQIWAYFGVL